MGKVTVQLMIEGGKATAGPQIAQPLAPLKVNIAQIITSINDKTKEFSGMQVPVKVVVDGATMEFEIKVGSPPVSSLIKKELKKEKLARAPFGTYVPKEGEKVENFSADLKFDQAVKIAKMKMDSMRTDNLKKAVKQVVASCVSLGVHVDGKHPKEILKEIDSGKFDSRIV